MNQRGEVTVVIDSGPCRVSMDSAGAWAINNCPVGMALGAIVSEISRLNETSLMRGLTFLGCGHRHSPILLARKLADVSPRSSPTTASLVELLMRTTLRRVIAGSDRPKLAFV